MSTAMQVVGRAQSVSTVRSDSIIFPKRAATNASLCQENLKTIWLYSLVPSQDVQVPNSTQPLSGGRGKSIRCSKGQKETQPVGDKSPAACQPDCSPA